MKELNFVPQKDHKTAVLDTALLAVVKGPNGAIVKNFSKDFAVRVPLDKVDRFKTGDLVQSFQAKLAPGTYTLEAVVMDRTDKKIGVQKSSLTVPAPSDKLAISDVVVVRRTERVKGGTAQNAFFYPGGEVVPKLTHTLKGGPGNALPFYFVVYPNPAIKEPPKLVMHFYKGGQYLGAAQAPLPKAQKDGRIPYIADLPAAKFTPGSYEIRLDVLQGNAKAQTKVDFQVE